MPHMYVWDTRHPGSQHSAGSLTREVAVAAAAMHPGFSMPGLAAFCAGGSARLSLGFSEPTCRSSARPSPASPPCVTQTHVYPPPPPTRGGLEGGVPGVPGGMRCHAQRPQGVVEAGGVSAAPPARCRCRPCMW